MSHSTSPIHQGTPEKIFSINWRLLGRRVAARSRQLRNSARYHADRTEYIPPTWMTRLRLSWFRLGLIALTAFVFTQKQIDFTVTLGNRDVAQPVAANEASDGGLSQFSLFPAPAAAAGDAPAWSVTDYGEGAVRAYIERFATVARTEEEKFRIPAPAKMAMAIVESQAGKSAAALDTHNHFPGGNGNRTFDNAWGSWRAHSQLIDRRFPELAHEAVNYQQWIDALARSGYSRDPDYAKKLITVIESFGLADL